MKIKWEIVSGVIGGVLSLIFFGGLAVTLNKMSVADFQSIYQTLSTDNVGLSIEKTLQMLQDMTGLFAVSLFVSLIFLIIALFLTMKERYLLTATGLYFVTGAILLFGTQFIAFPFAFFYFVAGVFSIYRLRKEA